MLTACQRGSVGEGIKGVHLSGDDIAVLLSFALIAVEIVLLVG